MCGMWVNNTNNGHFTDSADDAEKTFQPLEMITRDPKKAIEGADVVMIFIQTTYHQALAERIAQYFQDDQLVMLVPGYAGSLFYHHFAIIIQSLLRVNQPLMMQE